jgi:hypothetical protein
MRSERAVQYPLPDAILILLASGLTQLVADATEQEGRPLAAPYRRDWQRAVNQLAAACLQQDVVPPGDTMEALAWCRSLISDWPVTFAGPLVRPGQRLDRSLLLGDEPSDLCRELALTQRDAEMEIQERFMREALAQAQRHGRPDAYVALRRHLIERPVLDEADALAAAVSAEIAPVGALVHDLYEAVPASILAPDVRTVPLCGQCGWTLEWYTRGAVGGRWRCGDDRCRLLTDGFTRTAGKIAWTPQLRRVRRAIRRYVTAPGRYELDAARAFEGLGLMVELWPSFDTYDLHVTFSDGRAWAVDIKDWRHPQYLAATLVPFERLPGQPWSRAVYAIPDARARDDRGYVGVLRAATAAEGGRGPFDVETIGDLVAQAATLKEEIDGPR